MKDIEKIFDNWDFEEIDPNYSPLTDENFVKFLKDNNIHDKFIKNYHDYLYNSTTPIETYCSLKNESDYIRGAFAWVGTPEGNDFWEKINYNWHHFKSYSTVLI